jgi:hypothetical protein
MLVTLRFDSLGSTMELHGALSDLLTGRQNFCWSTSASC